MVTLSPKAVETLKKAGLIPEDVALVVARLMAAVPHIGFEDWDLLDEGVENIDTESKAWAHYTDDDGIHCHLIVNKVQLFSRLLPLGKLRIADLEFLDHMLREAAGLLRVTGETGVSLADFGMRAVSRVIADTMRLSRERVSGYLKFLRALSGETYENQRLSYGLVLSRTQRNVASALLEIENKRFKRLTDGFSTALELDRNGGINALIALSSTGGNKNSRLGRPWWLSALADTAERRGGIGIALTKGGDLLVVHQRELLFSQRAGEWRIWRHDAILEAIEYSWQTRGVKGNLTRVLRMLYGVALELAFRHSGGLLVVIESRAKIYKLVNSSTDVMGDQLRTNADKALDRSLKGVNVLNLDRRVIADLASLDGALVVDRTGLVLAYGAMVKSKKTTDSQGARTRAAEGASELGVAIKVSADGGISVYRKGERVLAL